MARRPKPQEQFTGITLEQWQIDMENIRWAQQEPRFKQALSVVLNESRLAHEMAAGCSEARAFGRVEGYHLALEVLRSLAKRPPKPELPIEATHDEPPENMFRDKEPLD